jgi:HEAT repeat protein
VTLRASRLAGWLAAAALGASLTGIAGAQTGAELERLVAQLGNETDAQARYDAYAALARARSPEAVPLLVQALPGYGVYAQGLGISVLQAYPIDLSHPALRRLLDPKSPFLELAAAVALQRSGAGDFNDHIVEPLRKAGVPAATRVAMLVRLYGIGDERVRAAVRALVTPDAETSVLEEALYQLLVAGDGDAAGRAKELLAAPGLRDDARAALAAFLVGSGDESQSAVVADMVRSKSVVLSRLQRFLVRAPRLGDPLLAAIVALVEGDGRAPESWNLTAALSLLARHAGSQHLPLLKRLLEHPDAAVAKAAFEAFQKRAGTLPPAALGKLLASDKPEMALAAADAMRRGDDNSGLPRVLELCRTQGSHRLEAVRILGRFRDLAAVRPLLALLEDGEVEIRTAASSGLSVVLANLFPYRRFDLSSTGYAANAPKAAREQGAQKIREWCDAHLPK